MSGITPETLAEFGRLLQLMLVNDNATRKQAEAAFTQSKQSNLGMVAACLGETLASHSDEGVRTMACVLLRQVCSVPAVWFSIPTPLQDIVKSSLLNCVRADPSSQVRRRACHCIAQICSNVVEGASGESSWGITVFPVCFEAWKSPDPQHKLVGMFLLSKVLEFSPDECIKPHLAGIIAMISEGFRDASGLPIIHVYSISALGRLLLRDESNEVRTAVAPLLLPMLMLVSGRLSAGDEGSAQSMLEDMIDIAKVAPGYLKPQMDNVAQAMASVASSGGLDPSIRVSAAEFLVSYAEAAPGMVRKAPVVLSTAIRLALHLMTLSDDDPDWEKEEYNIEGDADPSDPGDGDECAIFGGEALTRLSDCLRGDSVLAVAIPMIRVMVGSTPADATTPVHKAGEWQAKRAGLAALGYLASGSKKAIKSDLMGYVGMIGSSVYDAHQRVRHAALGSLALIAESLADSSKSYRQFCEAVVPMLANCIGATSGNSNRVRIHGVTALLGVLAHGDFACPPEAVVPHLEALLNGLGSVLALPSYAGRLQAINTISAIARCVNSEALIAFYPSLVAGLNNIVSSPNTVTQDLALKGAALQALASIGETVGRDKFAADGIAAMDLTAKWQAAGLLRPEDSFARDVLTAATKICKTLGELCVPYLPFIMPKLWESVSREVEMTVEDVEEGEGAAPTTSMASVVYEIRGVGFKRIGLNTSASEEREVACRMLYEFASNIGTPFLPFVEGTFNAIKPLIVHKWHAACRNITSLILPHLFEICVKAPEGAGLALAPRILMEGLKLVMEAAMDESDPDTRATQAEAVKNCMWTCANYPTLLDSSPGASTAPPPLALPLEQTEQLVQALAMCATASIVRRVESLRALSAKEDADQLEMEALEEELESETDLMEYLVDAMGLLLKMHRAAFLPIFAKHVAPAFDPLLNIQAPATLLWSALCVFVDVVEWCGPEAHTTYLPKLLPLLVASLRSEHENTRQCAVYGLGQVAIHAPACLAPVLPDVITAVVAMIRGEGARDGDNNNATENAISTLGKILRHFGTALPPQFNPMELGKLWLSNLPLREDECEAHLMHAQLLEMAKCGHALLTSDPSARAHMFSVFGEVLVGSGGGGGEDEITLATPQTLAEIVGYLKANREGLQACWGSLSLPQQQAITTVMQ